MKLTNEIKEREQLEAQVSELETEQADIASQLISLQQGNEPLKDQRSALQAELHTLHKDHEKEERDKRQHVRRKTIFLLRPQYHDAVMHFTGFTCIGDAADGCLGSQCEPVDQCSVRDFAIPHFWS